MPVPKPNKGETQDEFIARFMSNDTMKKEYSDQKQRLAIAFSTWRRARGGKAPTKSKMNLKFNYQVPIIESAFVNDDFIITGVALNATITSNNHKFIGEELRKSANTLNGVPLLVDHRNEVEAIKGRVISGEYDEEGQKVDFRAHIIDETMKEMVKDGRINSVSVGAAVEDLEETDDGFFIPRGIEFKELSLVAVPADAGATFTVALQEAYETATEKEVIESYSNAEEVRKAMTKFNKMKFNSNEERTLERLKIINAGRKFKLDTTEFEKTTSTQTEAKYIQQLNKSGGKIMEREDKTELEKEEETKSEEDKSEGEDKSEDKGVTEEKLQKMIENAVKKAVKSADEDEKEPEKESEESKDEESKEDSEDEESKDEAVAEEKGKYKIVQGYGALKGGSFTLVRA